MALATLIIREARASLSADAFVNLLVICAGADAPTSMTLREATVDLLGDPDATKPGAPAMAEAVCARLDRLAYALVAALPERPSLAVTVVATAAPDREPGAVAFFAGSSVRDVLRAPGLPPWPAPPTRRRRAVARAADAPTGARIAER